MRKVLSIKDLLWETASFVLLGSKVDFDYILAEDRRFDTNLSDPAQHPAKCQIGRAPGGTISLRVENLEIGESSDLPLESGPYIKTEIEDKGTGIPSEHLSRLFDPYFSTKEQGRGLGLTIAFSVVRRHGGTLPCVPPWAEGRPLPFTYQPSGKWLPRRRRCLPGGENVPGGWAEKYGFCGIVAKPFQIEELGQLLARVLNFPRGASRR